MVGIYKIENLINGKIYIGQSINIEERWLEHKRIANSAENVCDVTKKKKTYPLYIAMKKYGIENFSLEILEECPQEDLDEREKYYIKKYNSFIDFPNSNGYNLTLGGASVRLVSDEQIREIIELWNKKITVKKICEITGIEKHSVLRYLKAYSDYFIEESKNRGIRDSGIGHRKKVDCYDLEGNFIRTYSSITEASLKLKIRENAIIKNCKNKSQYVKNYRFTYEQKYKIIPPLTHYHKKLIKITKEGEEKILYGWKEAEKELGENEFSIREKYKKHSLIKGWKVEYLN